MFRQIHLSVGGGAHRPKNAIITMGSRMAWWPDLCHTLEVWRLECPACSKNRGKAIKAMATSSSLEVEDDSEGGCLPYLGTTSFDRTSFHWGKYHFLEPASFCLEVLRRRDFDGGVCNSRNLAVVCFSGLLELGGDKRDLVPGRSLHFWLNLLVFDVHLWNSRRRINVDVGSDVFVINARGVVGVAVMLLNWSRYCCC